MITAKQIEAVITNELNLHESQAMPDSIEAAAQKIYDLCSPDHSGAIAAAMLENEVTDSLVNLVAATVLATLVEEEGGGRCNIDISPSSMDHMSKHYRMEVTSRGLVRSIRIALREDSTLQEAAEWKQPSNRHGLVDVADTNFAPPAIGGYDALKPQAAPHEYNRPVWAIACSGYDGGGAPVKILSNQLDRTDAERELRSWGKSRAHESNAHIENRWCLHPACPSTGCNEDASKRDKAATEPTSD